MWRFVCISVPLSFFPDDSHDSCSWLSTCSVNGFWFLIYLFLSKDVSKFLLNLSELNIDTPIHFQKRFDGFELLMESVIKCSGIVNLGFKCKQGRTNLNLSARASREEFRLVRHWVQVWKSHWILIFNWIICVEESYWFLRILQSFENIFGLWVQIESIIELFGMKFWSEVELWQNFWF